MTSSAKIEELFYDVLIIGAGPASLSAAIKLKQENTDISIAIVEKSSEIGGHILSGAIFDANSLTQLLPHWREDIHNPVKLKVKTDNNYILSRNYCFKIPKKLIPKYLCNEECYVISLSILCRYLADQAAQAGVDIYPSFPAKQLLFNETGAVIGVKLTDFGLDKNVQPTHNFVAGAQIYSKYILIGEGVKGSLAREAIEYFKLDKGRATPKYALGIKEIWRIAPEHHSAGTIEHFIKPRLSNNAYGGGFIYHMENNKISLGLVTQLDYSNPAISPYQLFQQFKAHKKIRNLLANGKKLAYGAKAISCGGWYSIPQLSFKGGALIGCSAGLLNGARMKGIHNAISSGIYSANYVAQALAAGRQHDRIEEIDNNWRQSEIAKDLYPARNFKYLWQKFSIILAGLDIWWLQIFNQNLFKNLQNQITKAAADYQRLRPARAAPHATSKTDSSYNNSIAESLFYANLTHSDNQPNHLYIKNMALQYSSELKIFGGPSALYCPAGVYEWQENEGKNTYVINSQNCLHCKTCEIKDPNQNIQWQCPQGGSGPNYNEM